MIKKGVAIEPYDKTNLNHIPVYKPQSDPDVTFIFKNGTFIDKRTHALDQKTESPGLGNNRILSEITPNRYMSTIDRFQKELSRIAMPKELKGFELWYNSLNLEKNIELQKIKENMIPITLIPMSEQTAYVTTWHEFLLSIIKALPPHLKNNFLENYHTFKMIEYGL